MKINIDRSKASFEENKKWLGAGMVSGNNSSRLLLDYKAEHPESYYEILEHIFGDDGIGVCHLKIEMGSDINSSSGTEPCIMRTEDEIPDVTRGAGFQLAADVRKLYPEVTLDMLYWSEPAWVTAADDVYAARYRWYKENLKAAHEKYGLVFDFVSVSRNEREIDPEWIKYIAARLKNEKDCPYDFSRIGIVAADEENSWRIADIMACDEELRNAVDVIGSHYTSHSTDNVRLMADRYGKKVWFSEGSAPMNYSKGTSRFDGSGLAGINGVLDVANRIAAMYCCGGMTLYEYQPVVSAYYDGVCYCHKSLITAAEPWSGQYSLESGYYMSLHFSRFIKKGWSMIDSACFNDSKKGGDGHALVDTNYSFITACDRTGDDYSVIIVNSSDSEKVYEIETDSSHQLNVWETRGPDGGNYDENYFRKAGVIFPEESDGVFTAELKVKPCSLVTISTLDTDEVKKHEFRSQLLELPYNFEMDSDFAAERGGAPKYTTDQGGAFEIKDGRLYQVITPETKAVEWGATPLPTTNFGDDRWYNYAVSASVMMERSKSPDENYIGVGTRYSLACKGESGYAFFIYENGKWELKRNGTVVMSGVESFDPYKLNVISVSSVNRMVTVSINDNRAGEFEDILPIGGGRAAIYSSYNCNCFEFIKVTPYESEPYFIERYDDTDSVFEYSGEWEHRLMSGFADYKRTVSSGKEGASMLFRFDGSGFGIFGSNENAVISVSVDGEKAERVTVSGIESRGIFFCASGLENDVHEVEVKVISGVLNVDGAQVSR